MCGWRKEKSETAVSSNLCFRILAKVLMPETNVKKKIGIEDKRIHLTPFIWQSHGETILLK